MNKQPSRILLSFTSTVMMLSREELSWEDLDDSLWFFGCSRLHALDPAVEGPSNEWYWAYSGGGLKGQYATQEQKELVLLRSKAFALHLVKAEREGRCVWHSELRDGMREEKTWVSLTDLIARWYPEAYGLIVLTDDVPLPADGYNYRAAADYIHKFGLNSIPQYNP